MTEHDHRWSYPFYIDAVRGVEERFCQAWPDCAAAERRTNGGPWVRSEPMREGEQCE